VDVVIWTGLVAGGDVALELGGGDTDFTDELGGGEGAEELSAGLDQGPGGVTAELEAGGETGAELDGLGVVDAGGAVDFSVTVDLMGDEAGEEPAAPPLPEHLPPEDRVTSTQFFWSLTGVV
jgi:hypothetical protein